MKTRYRFIRFKPFPNHSGGWDCYYRHDEWFGNVRPTNKGYEFNGQHPLDSENLRDIAHFMEQLPKP